MNKYTFQTDSESTSVYEQVVPALDGEDESDENGEGDENDAMTAQGVRQGDREGDVEGEGDEEDSASGNGPVLDGSMEPVALRSETKEENGADGAAGERTRWGSDGGLNRHVVHVPHEDFPGSGNGNRWDVDTSNGEMDGKAAEEVDSPLLRLDGDGGLSGGGSSGFGLITAEEESLFD